MKKQTINEKVIRLIEGGQVDLDGHQVKLVRGKVNVSPCFLCDLEIMCTPTSEIFAACKICEEVLEEDCNLILVTNDNLKKK